MSKAVLDDWQELLPKTLENAVRAPYYRRRFGSAWRRVKSIEDLALLPTLDKPTAIRFQRYLVVGERPPGFGITSSGTTRLDLDMPPLNVLRCPEEADAIAGPALEPGQAAREDPDDPYPGWTLEVFSVTHGLPLPPGKDEIVVPWMLDRNALYMIEAVLSKPQPDGRRVTAMRLGTGALTVLTVWLQERGKDPSSFGVKLIGTFSQRLTEFWRKLAAERFGAQIFDNYSLSEFSTPATECTACGWLHFRWPPVLYEVLDLVTGKPREEGIGRLVLTGLHPYVQKMPLIRYDTGDAVELGPFCRVERSRGIRMHGRIRRGLVLQNNGGGAYLLAPMTVFDLLDCLAEVERWPHPCATLGIIRSRDVGFPRWVSEFDERLSLLRLRFEVRFDPLIFRERAKELETRVQEGLLTRDAGLKKLVRAGTLRLEVLAARPQSLNPPIDKFV